MASNKRSRGYAKTSKDKLMVEVADYLFANPLAKRGDILAKFGKIWQISPRGIDRMLKLARQHNEKRIKEVEEAKQKDLISAAKGQAKKEIASREEILTTFTGILRGKAVKRATRMDGDGNVIDYEISYPTRREMLSAGETIARMEGYYAPTRQELTGKDGAPLSAPVELTPEQIERLIDKL
jgi:hypothetical protein